MLKRFFGRTIAGLGKDVRRMPVRFRLYPTWAGAAQHATYEDACLTEFRAQKAEKIILGKHYEQIDTPGLNYLRLCAVHVRSFQPRVRIVDFGGSFGEEAMAFLHGNVPTNSAFTICESAALVERAGRIVFPQPISFIDQLSGVGRCDIFYSSGALPYIENIEFILESAINLMPFYIVLIRNSFSKRKIIRNQRSTLFQNGPQVPPEGDFVNKAIRYPHQTISLPETVSFVESRGYRLVASFPEDSGVYPYGNEVFGRDLVFISEGLLKAGTRSPEIV